MGYNHRQIHLSLRTQQLDNGCLLQGQGSTGSPLLGPPAVVSRAAPGILRLEGAEEPPARHCVFMGNKLMGEIRSAAGYNT